MQTTLKLKCMEHTHTLTMTCKYNPMYPNPVEFCIACFGMQTIIMWVGWWLMALGQILVVRV